MTYEISADYLRWQLRQSQFPPNWWTDKVSYRVASLLEIKQVILFLVVKKILLRIQYFDWGSPIFWCIEPGCQGTSRCSVFIKYKYRHCVKVFICHIKYSSFFPERGDNGLFITIVPKVFKNVLLFVCLTTLGTFKEF